MGTRSNIFGGFVGDAHKNKNKNAECSDKSKSGSPSTSVFLRAMFRYSAITPASPLVRKSTTVRSTLWCSHYSVAKQQRAVFVSSRQREFVAQVEKSGSRSLDLFFLGLWQSIFYCSSIDEQYQHEQEFSRIFVRCNVFFLALQHDNGP